MTTIELIKRIRKAFTYEPTESQCRALDIFSEFVLCRNERSAMILRGSAGTGKSTLISAIITATQTIGMRYALLAPTGRAAKALERLANHKAFTIHRAIYRQEIIEEREYFRLIENHNKNVLFVVDEASMITNDNLNNSLFGSGRLLNDLIKYVYGGKNCHILFVGDTAQLPPIDSKESPALSVLELKRYDLEVFEANLKEVVRQSQLSGILWNATYIRNIIEQCDEKIIPKIKLSGFEDVYLVDGNDLVESISCSYSTAGEDETVVITRSNKRANIYNQGIRTMILGREKELCCGDVIMIVKNKYLKSESDSLDHDNIQNEQTDDDPFVVSSHLSFIANGDRAIVKRIKDVHEMHSLHFAEITLSFPDYNDYELTSTVILDTLTSDAPSLSNEQTIFLQNAVKEDYADVVNETERTYLIRNDKYLHALQIKYAYATTCHKTQGGQWSCVYVDMGYVNKDMLTTDYYHWLYTAFTRATQKLFLVNWPKEMIE